MLKKIQKISESLVVENWEENKETFLSKIKKFDPLSERDNGDQIFYLKAGLNYAVWDKRHNIGLILVESKIKEQLNIDFRSLFDNKIKESTEKLVKGSDLSADLQNTILNQFPYRNTKENSVNSRRYNPTAEIVQTDKEWLASHAFYITKNGDLSKRRKYAEPAFMVESEIKESKDDDSEFSEYLDSLAKDLEEATKELNKKIDAIQKNNQKEAVDLYREQQKALEDGNTKLHQEKLDAYTNLMKKKIDATNEVYSEYKKEIEQKIDGATKSTKKDKFGEISESQHGNFEVHWFDGVKYFKNLNKATEFAKDIIMNFKGSKEVSIYRSGLTSTTDEKYLIGWYGNRTYWDNRSKKEPELLSKKIQISESQNISESLKQSDLKLLSIDDLISILKGSADDIKVLIKTIEKRKDITDRQNKKWWSIVDDLSNNIHKD